MRSSARTVFSAAVAGAFAISLAACQSEEVTTEPDVEDLSGGEMITTPVDQEGIEVELPETPMTNVPAEDTEAEGEAAAE